VTEKDIGTEEKQGTRYWMLVILFVCVLVIPVID
jgi:hypothetical protein